MAAEIINKTPLLTIRPMSAATLCDCVSVWSTPPEGWCWCVAWEVDGWDGWTDRTAEQNRSLREQLWSEGKYFGYLFYADGEPIGWVRVGSATAWPKLIRHRRIRDAEKHHVITCVGLVPKARKKGYLQLFLRQVIDELFVSGVPSILAFPKRFFGKVDDGAVWNGPKSIYEKLGFLVVREEAEFFEMQLDVKLPLRSYS